MEEIKKARSEIYYDGQVLHLGKPEMRPQVPTWREYFLKYEGYSSKDLKKRTFARSPLRLTTRIWTPECVASTFATNGLENLKAAKILGNLKRHEGSFTGADVLYVTFDEPITLSWLQWALHAAGEPSNIHDLRRNGQ